MRKFFNLYVFYLLLVFVFLLIFRSWFLPGVIAGGDLPYYFPKFIHEMQFLSAWDIQNKGMGSSMLPTLWLQFYSTGTVKLLNLLPWNIYIRVVWFFPYIIFAIASSFLLSRWYFKNIFFNLLASFLYVGNTYALLLVGGGQMGIALSYAVAPLGLLAFENFLAKLSIRSAILFSLAFSFIFLLDIRVAYVLLIVLGIRFLFELLPLHTQRLKKFLLLIALSGIFIVGLHAFWLLPTLLTHGSAISEFGAIYTSSSSIAFFSFAKSEDAFGLLHPNWPENIFGLTHFMQPEFLLLPILTFSSLLFVSSEKKEERIYILYFALIGLIGAFLAKGANDPFGGIYIWLFNHIPGFIMFRDPTKWYLLIALSYSMLIPYSVKKIYEWLKEQKISIFNIHNIFLFIVLAYVLFLIRPAIFGQLGGTFQPHQVPQDYVQLEQFLNKQQQFSRTLWVPTPQRFGFTSYTHPAVSAEDLFHVASISGVLDMLQKDSAENLLQQAAIQYVIVPYDSEHEIFLKDRKYNNALYVKTIQKISAMPWLAKISGFGNIAVFQVPTPKDHFYLLGNGSVSYTFVNPTQYKVQLHNAIKGEKLVFSESYDKYWVMQDKRVQQKGLPYDNLLNSFIVTKGGSYTVTLTYIPQQWVDIGLWISGISFLSIVLFLFYHK